MALNAQGLGHELPDHPCASLVPRMTDEEFATLKADIAEHGQREPIVIHEGQIVDGRHRYRACQELGLDPQFRDWDGEGALEAFVVSLNVHRRHLSPSQRGAIAAEMLPAIEKEAVARMMRGQSFDPEEMEVHPAEKIPQGDSKGAESVNPGGTFPQGRAPQARDIAAMAVGVNPHYVSDAKRVKDAAPELFEAVREGRVSIPEAKAVVQLPEETRATVIRKLHDEPETNVKTLVRKTQRSQAEFEQKESQRRMQIVGDSTGDLARGRLNVQCRDMIYRLGQILTKFTPDYVHALEREERDDLVRVVLQVRNWARSIDAEMSRPVRLLVGGENDAHVG